MKIIGLILLLISSSVHAEGRLSHEQIIKTYGFWKISEVVNYFTVLETADPGTKILSCDPSAKVVQDLMGGELHALADGSRKAEVERYRKNPGAISEKVKSCAKDCTCDGYAMIIDDAEINPPQGPEHAKNKALVEGGEKKESHETCARKAKWFCGSSLQTYLYPTKP